MSKKIFFLASVAFLLAGCNPAAQSEATRKQKEAVELQDLRKVCKETIAAKRSEFEKLKAASEYWPATIVIRQCANALDDPELKALVADSELKSYQLEFSDPNATADRVNRAAEWIKENYPERTKEIDTKLPRILAANEKRKQRADDLAATAVVASQPVDTWKYGSSTDKMTGVTSYHATTDSLNTADFIFPYAGKQHARFMVTASSLILWIERGQIICQSYIDPCRVLVKLDQSQPQYYNWHSVGDDSTTIASNDKSLIKRLYTAKKMTVRLQVYQNGYPDFDFTVFDLKPIQKDKKT